MAPAMWEKLGNRGFNWNIVEKTGEMHEQGRPKLGKTGSKWGKVVETGKKWRKLEKSGFCRSPVTPARPYAIQGKILHTNCTKTPGVDKRPPQEPGSVTQAAPNTGVGGPGRRRWAGFGLQAPLLPQPGRRWQHKCAGAQPVCAAMVTMPTATTHPP